MESKITGELTYKDYLHFDLYKRRYSFLIIWFVGIITGTIVFPLDLYSFLNKIILLGIPSTSYVIGLFLVVMIGSKREYRSLNKRFHERVIKFDEEGLFYGMKEKQGNIQWNDIKRVVFLRRMIVLYTRSNQPFLIPKHFFSSSVEEKEWVHFIKKHVPS